MSAHDLLLARAHEAVARSRSLGERNVRTLAQSLHITASVRLALAAQLERSARETLGFATARRGAAEASLVAAREAARLSAEIERRDRERAEAQAQFERALASRDVIGQAKGIIIAACRCSSDEAFSLLRRQSQHQNRKLIDVAQEIVDNAQHPA
jgi:AmiR/NasT family two-component response regulator